MSKVRPIKTYQFAVDGLPPHQCVERWRWSKPASIARLVELRHAAHAAMDGAAPLLRSVRVRFVLTLPAASPFACDLDDFVTGICDGLQRADPASSSVLGTRWHDPRLRDIHPTRFGAISDDREIVFIQAEKRLADCEDASYVVEISGE